MKCPKCHADLNYTDRICTQCGANTLTIKFIILFSVKLMFFIIGIINFPIATIALSAIYLLIITYKKVNSPEYQKRLAEQREQQNIEEEVFREAAIREATEPVLCPKCHSPHVAPINDRKTFSVKKAVVGGVLVGGIGTLAGFAGSNKNKIMCMKCGFKWEP